MPTKNNDKETLTGNRVADYLKVAERAIYRRPVAKKPSTFRVGGIRRFCKKDLEGLIPTQSESRPCR